MLGNTCKLAISFLSSFCPATSPPPAPEATAATDVAKKAGVLPESRAQPDADSGVSTPLFRATGAPPEKDGTGLVYRGRGGAGVWLADESLLLKMKV
jgi:hypothetical protein